VVFSSLRFFVFMAAILGATAIPMAHRSKKLLLCTASCLFYAAWDYRYLALLLLISVIDYLCAARIAAAEQGAGSGENLGVLRAPRSQLPASERPRRLWLTASIVSNLAILGYFKYANFFIANLNGLLAVTGREIALLKLILPAGISFYTFKSMSYTIDVYRRRIPPCESRLDYTMFVTFFPDLIAGPIVRASVFLPQIARPIGPSRERLLNGGSLFLIGMGKKLLVADQLALVADAVFSAPATWSAAMAWCGLIAYALQIYCDFSGYSDMAIGTAKMLGYDLPENFNMPYLAASVAEFWRRWHITLSQWLRDYLYIPLGGNRHGERRTYVNLIVTMLLGGLWHGASWNFVLWGFLHGSGLAVHRLWREHTPWRLPRAIAWPLTLGFVTLCWVPFRAPNFALTVAMLRTLFGFGAGRNVWWPLVLGWSLVLVIAGTIVGVALANMRNVLAPVDATLAVDAISGIYPVFRMRNVAGGFAVAAGVYAIYLFGAVNTSPFIYFQF
jgi:alginate O-acetyltransferase complex protein AlgI